LDPATLAETLADGQTLGEIMFRGNIVMKGYLKNPQATAKSFEGGWFHTGDLGVMEPDRYVKIKDRSKDVIISGGENISSLEVEDALYRHSAVLACAVVAEPDARWAEPPLAYVELKPDALARDDTLRALVIGANGRAFCAGHDLKEMRAAPSLAYYQQLFERCSQMMLAIQRLPVPVIARVNGLATAAGCQLVAACDLA